MQVSGIGQNVRDPTGLLLSACRKVATNDRQAVARQADAAAAKPLGWRAGDPL